MTLTHKDRRNSHKTQYGKFQRLFKDGYYIRKTKNTQSITRGKYTTLYELVKDWNDKSRLCYCYLAHDIALLFVSEYGAKIREDKRMQVWLNDNPEKYHPAPGCKIIVSYSQSGTVERLLS